MVAYQLAVLCSIVCSVKLPVAIGQVSGSEIPGKEPHAILALESVSQERSIFLIEIIGEMSCFQVEAAEDVGWIVAPDESMFGVPSQMNPSLSWMMSFTVLHDRPSLAESRSPSSLMLPDACRGISQKQMNPTKYNKV